MIVKLLATLVVAGIAFVAAELIRRRVGGDNEVSRKIVHVLHGLTVATWPFVLGESDGYRMVLIAEVLFIFCVVAARRFHMFRWMWKVGRKSWGEILYPLGVIGAVVWADDRWVFLAAVLSLAVADAVAALVGKKFGKGNSYKILGQTKSVIGSAAFFITAVGIVSLVAAYGPGMHLQYAFGAIVGVALILMVVENAGIYGMDNLTLPLASVLLLNILY